jgi:phosphoenolpyruvate-protein kinase (PTS system EI component)
MPSNRRRNAVVLPIATWAMWTVLVTFISCAGLYYVYCKNQIHTGGEEQKALEKELVQLQNAVEEAKSRVNQLSSYAELKLRRERDKTFLAGYMEIDQKHVVLVSDQLLPRTPAELRAVANTTP